MVFAAGALTKYTFLFMAPVFLLWLIIARRDVFMKKQLYLGIALCALLLSPVVVYNAMMWSARGHPDAALSTIIGQHPADFRGLVRTTQVSFDVFSTTVGTVAVNFSFGVGIMLALGVAYFVYCAWKGGDRRGSCAVVLLGLLLAMTMLSLTGEYRFGVVLLPFVALIIGASTAGLYERVGRLARIALLVVLPFVALWELVFMMQSQLMAQPFLNHALLVSVNKPSRGGYNALEAYVQRFYKVFAGRAVANTYAE